MFSFYSAGYCQNLDELIPTSHHDSATVVPKFVSRGHLYKAIVGDTIELPCKVQNLGNTYISKREYKNVLEFNSIKCHYDNSNNNR